MHDPASAAIDAPEIGRRSFWRGVNWRRSLRMWSGIILFAFLTMHLLNHAAGLFGIEAMDFFQTWRWMLWMNPPGLMLLYGALGVHFALACWRIAAKKSFRMSLDEAFQIGLGLLIPVLLFPHLMNTRIAATWFGGNTYYEAVLRHLWPEHFFLQLALVLVAWAHGVVGLALAFRHRRWFARVRTAGFVLAILIPAFSIAGFIVGGREARMRVPDPSVEQSAEQQAGLHHARMMSAAALGSIGALVAVLVYLGHLRRQIGNKIVINYRGRGPVRVPRGASILDASRIHAIPHPSMCRGRGRCSTCRVQILSDLDGLPAPSVDEQAVLDRIGAHTNVRLACQLRPENDIAVRILLPVLGRAQDPESIGDTERWAVERVATVLALDLRAFNVLAQSRLPYELVALVNRFGSEMRQAVEHHGGSVSTFYGDGLVAVFDDATGERGGARQAIAAARDMSRVLKVLNREMGGALPIPIRAGIGIHTGRVTLARIGATDQASGLMAFGPTVTVATRLLRATKLVLTDCLLSSATARYARIETASLKVHEIEIEGGDDNVTAFAVTDWRVVRGGRGEAQGNEHAEAGEADRG